MTIYGRPFIFINYHFFYPMPFPYICSVLSNNYLSDILFFIWHNIKFHIKYLSIQHFKWNKAYTALVWGHSTRILTGPYTHQHSHDFMQIMTHCQRPPVQSRFFSIFSTDLETISKHSKISQERKRYYLAEKVIISRCLHLLKYDLQKHQIIPPISKNILWTPTCSQTIHFVSKLSLV